MIDKLLQDIKTAFQKLDIDSKKQKLAEFEQQMASPDFWNDSDRAQIVSKDHAKLKSALEPWLDLQAESADLKELIDLKDDSLAKEIEDQQKELQDRYKKLETLLRYDGQYDTRDAIITIQSGAGGTDAQDWAQMLQRMYLRWAEKSDLSVEVMGETAGEEAGIKNTTISIAGDPYTYGKLRRENGVHRLVRISPFNSGGTRETSFAMVEVMPRIDEPGEIDIEEKDLRIDTYRAGGNGGQSVNTTDSAVRITHLPTGVTVSMQNEKSQIQNRAAAMKILASRLAQLKEQQHKDKISELKGPNQEAAWGNQIRNYVLHPYKMVKNTDGSFESVDVDGILDGGLEELLE